MFEAFFVKPILNSPYDYPARHWELNKDGLPTNQIVDKRRRRKGRFREDLFARINLWTFSLPCLRECSEDIEPNLDYELDRYARERAQLVRFSAEGRRWFVKFATSPEATWTGKFRDLNAAMIRMTTLAPGERVTNDAVSEDLDRLLGGWRKSAGSSKGNLLRKFFMDEQKEDIDLLIRLIMRRSSKRVANQSH